MKDYIEERAIDTVYYFIENNAAVKQTAKQFGISKIVRNEWKSH